MIRYKGSLAEKAFIGILAILFPILITFFLCYIANKECLKRRILDTLTVIAEAYEGQVYQFLEMAKRRTLDFSSDGFIRGQVQKIICGNKNAVDSLHEHLIKNKLTLDNIINTIHILSLEGRVVASTNSSEIGMDLSRESFFVRGKDSVTIEEYHIRQKQIPQLAISSPIFIKNTGKLIGVIVNFVQITELNKLLLGEYDKELGAISWNKGKGVWKTLEIYLVNKDKRMITQSLFVKDTILKQAVDILPVEICLTSNKETAGFYKDYRGVEVAGVSMYIPSMKWVLLVEIDKDEVLAPVKQIFISVLITTAVVIITVVVLFFNFLKRMVLPLRKISGAAKDIASGNLDVAIPVQSSDEIGTLSESFNYMTRQIKTRTTALKKSEARLAEAQQIARVGNWEWDIIKNEVYWSDEVYRILHVVPQGCVAAYEAFLNFVHPDDRGFVKKSVDDALYKKKLYDIEHRILLKNETVRIVHEKGVVTFDYTGKAIRMAGTMQDITEHKRAEEEIYLLQTIAIAITESKDFLSALGIVLRKVCETTGWIYGEAWIPSPDDNHLTCSMAWYGIRESLREFRKESKGFTFSPGIGLPGRVWSSKKPEWREDATVNGDFLRAAFAKKYGLKAAMGIPVIARDKVIAVLCFFVRESRNEDGRLINLVSAVANQLGTVIQRKLAEEALRESEEKLKSILDNTTAIVYVKDLKGKYTFINRQFERLFHINKDEVKGKTDRDLWPVGVADTFRAHDIKVIEAKAPLEFDEVIPHKDGQHMYLSIKFPLFDSTGTIYAICGISTDITERKQVEETKTQLSAIMEATTDIVGTANVDGRILYINKAGRKILGIDEDEDVTHLYIFNYHPQWVHNLLQNEGIPTAICEGVWIGDIAFLNRDGHEIPFSQVIIAHKNSEGSVKYLSTIARDLTERKCFETQIVYIANRDPLTDLFNRRRFQEELESHLTQSRRFGTQGALLFLDIDNFKYINDSLGHKAGDKLLITLTNLLKERLRKTDILARLGGDEFAIILPHIDMYQAESIVNQLRELVQHRTLMEESSSPGITVSIGIAVFPGHGDTTETLLTYADLAMYHAKEEGRNRVCLYTSEQKSQIELRLTWERRVREAFKQDRFALHLQPIMDLQQNCIIGHEVLLRMMGEKEEYILPSQFLNIAERFGLIYDIDRWVVHKSINLIKRFQQDGKPAYLEVNLSGKSFTDTELLPLIKKELIATNIDPMNLIFEITETSIIENMATAQCFIADLKSLGCRFALDDFGIGFSSFNYLKHLPVDYLKIDGSFISNLSHSLVDQHLVKAMVEVACGLGKKTIAEFVENEETLTLLQKFGVNYAQGYYIGKPQGISGL